jgi:tRNA threonylcarbamoyladenosine biosynthesis protein TsaE
MSGERRAESASRRESPLTQAELEAAGEALGRQLEPGELVTFEGELGVGKTTFIKAVARGLGVAGPATSPTYALVHRYRGRRGPVFHLDCFRLRSPDEAADLDWEGLMQEGDAVLVEWPERAAGWIPAPSRRFRLYHVADPQRRGLESL